MFLGKFEITKDWRKLKDLITVDTGKTYTLQNCGACTVYAFDQLSEPDTGDEGMEIYPKVSAGYEPDSGDLWLKVAENSSINGCIGIEVSNN